MPAERLRLEVVANNIANALSTRSANGGPYRRQDVVFSAVLNQRLGGARSQLGGVQAAGIAEDMSPLHRIHNPGHPDADKDGYLTMPNIDLPVEITEQSYGLLRSQGG